MESEERQGENNLKPNFSDSKLTLSVQEAAELIGSSKPTMFHLLNSGKIAHKRISKKTIISHQAVVDWINQ